MCYQNLPEHFRGDFPHFFRRLANVDSAFESIPELSLTSAARMNLCLNDNINIAELARDVFCFIERRGDFTSRRCNIEPLQQLPGLIFVNVHLQRATVSSPPPSIRRKWNSLQNADQQRFFFYELACLFKIEPSTVAVMTISTKFFSLVFPLLITISLALTAGTPEQEKAFADKYKKAFEGKDTATLESFLYTQGADPETVGFYKMMQSGEAGEKISSIELVNLTPEDVKKATTPMDSPTGGKVCLTLKPTKKLVIKVEKKDANGSSTSSSENFVAEKDGKFVIPVPGPCK
jgi:hypothetical protein